MAWLISTTSEGRTRLHTLHDGDAIGSSHSCKIHLLGATVPALAARLRTDDLKWWLEPVNDCEVSIFGGGPEPFHLAEGCRIRIGHEPEMLQFTLRQNPPRTLPSNGIVVPPTRAFSSTNPQAFTSGQIPTTQYSNPPPHSNHSSLPLVEAVVSAEKIKLLDSSSGTSEALPINERTKGQEGQSALAITALVVAMLALIGVVVLALQQPKASYDIVEDKIDIAGLLEIRSSEAELEYVQVKYIPKAALGLLPGAVLSAEFRLPVQLTGLPAGITISLIAGGESFDTWSESIVLGPGEDKVVIMEVKRKKTVLPPSSRKPPVKARAIPRKVQGGGSQAKARAFSATSVASKGSDKGGAQVQFSLRSTEMGIAVKVDGELVCRSVPPACKGQMALGERRVEILVPAEGKWLPFILPITSDAELKILIDPRGGQVKANGLEIPLG